MRKILISLLYLSLVFINSAFSAIPCNDANNQACFLMEDTGTESNESINSSDGVTESGGTIPRNTTDFKFGTSSRDFELGDTEYLVQNDGLSTDISGADQAMSIVAWIKFESAPAAMGIVSKYDGGTSNRQYAMYVNADQKIEFFKSDTSASGVGFDTIVGDTVLSTNTWYHVAGVYDDTDMRVYVDGDVDSTPLAESGGIYNGSFEFRIGRHGNALYFDGLLDDVGIFDKALTESEIEDIITYGLASEAPGITSKSQVIGGMF